MRDFNLEDTVILIDSSRSMLRRDFKPNRLIIALETVKNFINSKFSIDPKDRIAIISFGDDIKKLSPFLFESEKLLDSLTKIQISGKGEIYDAIAFALQLLVEEMRKIGGKTQRIFIVSDDKLKNDPTKIQKLIKIAKGLGIFIDTCQLGKSQDFKASNLQKIAQMTGGEHGYFNNSKALINAGKSFASKKAIKQEADYLSGSNMEDKTPLLNEIALNLRRPTVLEIRMMMSGKGNQEKCQICHSPKAPLTNADFYSEGRYCPSCDRPMHLSCAAMWARKSETNETIFRCPFCYFLLEIPKSITQLVEKILDEKSENKVKIISEEDDKSSRMILIPMDQIEKIEASCSYCNNIFLGDFKVYQCEKCGSFYHEPCFKKMFNEIKSCRFCGAKISFD